MLTKRKERVTHRVQESPTNHQSNPSMTLTPSPYVGNLRKPCTSVQVNSSTTPATRAGALPSTADKDACNPPATINILPLYGVYPWELDTKTQTSSNVTKLEGTGPRNHYANLRPDWQQQLKNCVSLVATTPSGAWSPRNRWSEGTTSVNCEDPRTLNKSNGLHSSPMLSIIQKNYPSIPLSEKRRRLENPP